MVSAQAFQDVETESQSVLQQGNDSGAAQALRKKAQTAAAEAEAKLARVNAELVRYSTYFVAEVDNVEAQQERARGAVFQALTFNPEAMDILMKNADQLLQLKQTVVAEQQVAKENRKKMLLWLSGCGAEQQQGASTTQPGQLSAADAVKRRGFRPLQLPGSNIAAAATAAQHASSGPSWQQALKFWQIGTQNSKQPGVNRAAGDAPGSADQQPRGSLSSLLFGNKSKRQSSPGAADTPGSRVSVDPAASWRSSADGSLNGRRSGSGRSSETGATAAAAAGSSGAVLSSLAAGEGPLSKRHSQLATKPGAQQEQILGQALEIVAEDEREGRDSPAPPEPQASKVGGAGQALGLAPIRVPRASVGNRPGGPVDSFSFDNRPEDEAQSPSFLRSSVSSRAIQLQGPVAGAAAAGPLVRSSTALRASMAVRVDPFEAPEPEPQPFVEALQEQGSAGGSQGGLMAALRRSISGGGRASRWDPEAAAGSRHHLPQQSEQRSPAAAAATALAAQQQQVVVPEGDAGVHFLDLDATRAYALGVHQVMMRLEQNMQGAHSVSEAGSRPQSPRGSSPTDAPAADTIVAQDETAADDEGEAVHQSRAAADGGQLEQEQEMSGEQQQQQRQRRPQQLQPGPEASPPDKTAPGTAAATPHSEATDVLGMPPLRSGLSSPAVRHYAATSTATTPRQPLPLMGQGSIDILERQLQLTQQQLQQQQLGASRQASLLATSTNVSLAEVYKATSGNLAPLSSNLTGRRQSSSASKAPSQSGLPPRGGALAASSSRGLLGGLGQQPSSSSSSQAGMVPFGSGGGRGPLSMQYGSTMQQAKKSAQAAGLQQQRAAPAGWTWQQGGAAGGGPLGLDELGTMDPMAALAAASAAAAANNNKYASSWGLGEAGSQQQLSRQGSLTNSRQPSGGPLSRQGSGSVRASPRISATDEQAWQQQGAAAGRYAGSALTPNSVSPRSGTATPGREDGVAAGGMVGRQQATAGRAAVKAAAAGAVIGSGSSSRQAGAAGVRGGVAHAREAEGVDSEGYESAEEQLSSGASGLSSGGSGPAYQSASAAGRAAGGGGVSNGNRDAQAAAAAAGAGGHSSGSLPQPPAFLSGKPTSAQAAVAAQWSPSKHASAFAQAPAYMREPVLRITPEASSTSLGLAPSPAGPHAGTYRDMHMQGVSLREEDSTAAAAAAAAQRPGRVSSGSIGAGSNKFAQAYEGSHHNIYAPLGPPVPRSSSGRLQQQQYQVQPQVLTAVDLARRQSQARRESLQHAGSDYDGLSSSRRTSNSNSNASPHTLSGFQGGGAVGSPSYPYPRQQQQQQWGTGSSSSSANIYARMRPPAQRQQYRF